MAYPRRDRRKAIYFGLAAWALSGALMAEPVGNVVPLMANLSASAEVPPNKSLGVGTLEGTYSRETRIINYTVSYSGLSGPVKAGHFHGPALAGANAGVVLPFVDGLDSPIKGTAILTEAQAADLMAGKWYVNLHTAEHAGGEIRGQVQGR